MVRRRRIAFPILAAIGWVTACGVDYRSDQSLYDKLLCQRDPTHCLDAGGVGGIGGLGASGGIGGSFGGTGGMGGSLGGSAGVAGMDGGGGSDGGPCTNGQTQCVGSTQQTCSNGIWISKQCTGSTPACEAGVCVACVNGSKRCDTGGFETCLNHVWQVPAPCTGSAICQDGNCVIPPSCSGLASDCGVGAVENCCETVPVEGGTFNRNNDPTYPASVSSFLLDKYEITVGRFRKFVEAYPYTPPTGGGENPKIQLSGWSSTFDASLPADQTALLALLKCSSTTTWTDAAGANEQKPMNCLDWYTAFAFCIWDGGRLPTDLEWNYAAAGGDQQRVYPWGATVPGADAQLAAYGCYYKPDGTCTVDDIAPVGVIASGYGRWLHADLAGNAAEWNLDYTGGYPTSCVDCANIVPGTNRVVRGGGFDSSASLLTTYTVVGADPSANTGHGARCARNP